MEVTIDNLISAFPNRMTYLRAETIIQFIDCCVYTTWKSEFETVDIAMQTIDEILGTYGVESIEGFNIYGRDSIVYCNTGDTYKTTVIFDHLTKCWSIGCWGDIVETDRRFLSQTETV